MEQKDTHLNKSTLSLRIKKQFLMQIVSGQKKEEYRSFDDYYISRFCILNKDFLISDMKRFEFVYFYVGNKKDSLFAIVKCNGIYLDTFETEIKGAPPVGTRCFTIELGEVVETNV